MASIIFRVKTFEIDVVWDVLPVVLSGALTFFLWRLDVTALGPAIAAGFLLELVIVCHRTLHAAKMIHPLLGQVSSFPDLPKTVEHISSLADQPGRLKLAALNTIVKDFAGVIAHLGNGRVSLPPDEFMKIANAIYGSLGTSDSLVATSLSAGGDYWIQNFGTAYAKLNRDAHTRGASIDRIYIFRDRAHFEEKKHILQNQQSFSNVHVILNDHHKLEPDEERDAFVINEDIAAEFVFNDRYVIKHIDLITDALEIQRLRTLLYRLRSLARPFTSY